MRGLAIAAVLALQIVSAQAQEEIGTLLARIDAVRIPAQPFTATLEITRLPRPAVKASTSRYRMFTRIVTRDGRPQFETLLACTAPAADAGKLLLFVGEICWMRDLRAKNATRIAPQQLWSQPVVADSLNWRFTRDFEATLAGSEAIETGDGRQRSCRILELVPNGTWKGAPARLRCWADAEGRPWRAEHYAASGKRFRVVDYLRHEVAGGSLRPLAMRISSGPEVTEVSFSDVQTRESPARYFEVENLGTLRFD